MRLFLLSGHLGLLVAGVPLIEAYRMEGVRPRQRLHESPVFMRVPETLSLDTMQLLGSESQLKTPVFHRFCVVFSTKSPFFLVFFGKSADLARGERGKLRCRLSALMVSGMKGKFPAAAERGSFFAHARQGRTAS
jgi:hypothetical protein